MTPTKFVADLAEMMGVGHTEIATVDRALAKQGLRQISRGRYRPDVTLREGVQIVCAWAGAKKLTEAAAEVERLERFFPKAIPADEYKITMRHTTTLASIFETEESNLYGMSFVEVVCWLAQQLGAEKYPAEKVWISIEKGGLPDISCDWQYATKRLEFNELPAKLNLEQKCPSTHSNVKISAAIRGSVLKWLFDVTGDS